MPTYFLNLIADGECLIDETGFKANNLDAARRKGVRCATDVLRMITRRDHHAIEGVLLDQERRELVQMTLAFSARPIAVLLQVVSRDHEP